MKLDLFKKKVEEIYDQYPLEIRKALFSFDNAVLIRETGKNSGLEEKQISLLAGEVGMVLLGAARPEEMPDRLVKLLGISPQQAGSIFREINRKIFFPIKEKIAEAYKIGQSAGLAELAAVEERKPVSSPVVNLKRSQEGGELKGGERELSGDKEMPASAGPESKKRLEKSPVEAMVSKEIKGQPAASVKGEKTEKESAFPKAPAQRERMASAGDFQGAQLGRISGVAPKVISFQKELEPIADIDKPQESAEEIFRSTPGEEEPLFGKIEFAGGKSKKKRERKPPPSPKFPEIEYRVPKKSVPFKKVISFEGENDGQEPEVEGNTIKLKK